ncbi:MAG: hypothetical protein AABY07_08580 [Nanoarchaeota archaeon]
MANKRLAITIVFIIILIIGFLIYSRINPKEANEKYERPSSLDVVEQYFSSWSNKNYPNMYATISDGFKKIEPTAKNLATFEEYTKSQKIDSINMLSIKEKSNDGNTAIVDYSIEFVLSSGGINKFDGSFSLKYKQGDVIPGWKLIHPYGDNIDLS